MGLRQHAQHPRRNALVFVASASLEARARQEAARLGRGPRPSRCPRAGARRPGAVRERPEPLGWLLPPQAAELSPGSPLVLLLLLLLLFLLLLRRLLARTRFYTEPCFK
jgi:hypothetical protein